MIRFGAAVALCVFIGCGGGKGPAPEKKAVTKRATPKPPADLSIYFAKDGQTGMELVEDNLLGKDYLPGGNLAQYDKGGKKYQQFLIQTRDSESAAMLAFEIKAKLDGAKFVPHFGGYFGRDGDDPVFIFPKGKHVGGYVGLSQEDADADARDFAHRVPN